MSKTKDAIHRYAEAQGWANSAPPVGWLPKKPIKKKYKDCPACKGVFLELPCPLCHGAKKLPIRSIR